VEAGVVALKLPKPEYPLALQRAGEQGTVVLRVEVKADGRVGAIEVIGNPGYPRLVQAAIKAARKARFRPATLDGKPVDSFAKVPYRFRP
jgi:protein TonB